MAHFGVLCFYFGINKYMVIPIHHSNDDGIRCRHDYGRVIADPASSDNDGQYQNPSHTGLVFLRLPITLPPSITGGDPNAFCIRL